MLLGITLLFAQTLTAFAISSQYSAQYPLEISPGEQKEVPIILQNLAGTEEIAVKGILLDNMGIAELSKENKVMDIPLGEKREVVLKISIPENTALGTSYNVKMLFSTTAGEQEGNLGFTSSVEKIIPIKVVERTEASGTAGITGKSILGMSSTTGYILLAIVIIIIIIIAVIKRKSHPKKINKLK